MELEALCLAENSVLPNSLAAQFRQAGNKKQQWPSSPCGDLTIPALAIVLHRGCSTLRLTASNRVFGLAEGHPTLGRQRFTGKRIIAQSDDKDFVMVSYATSIWIRALHDG